MNDRRSDSELVAAHLGGDRSALAAIYDRYADRLYDTAAAMLSDRHDAEDLAHDVFVVAAGRLDQLRDPERLKPWLFAILRHEVYRRTKRRSRVRPVDFTEDGVGEMAAAHDPLAEAGGVEEAELAAFVRAASDGLAERDRLLLELSVRQGLTGADLADAVGVTPQQCHVLVHRMRDRVQRSIGALAVARYGRSECPDLQALLRGWDGTFDPPTRKRIAGHVDDCDICERTRTRFAVIPLLSAAPAFAAPASLRNRVLASASGPVVAGTATNGAGYRFDSGGFPIAPGSARRLPLVAAALFAVLLVLGGTLVAVARSGTDDAAGTATSAPAGTPAAPTAALGTSPPSSVPPSPTTASTAPTTPPTTPPATTAPVTAPTTVPSTTTPPTSEPRPTTTSSTTTTTTTNTTTTTTTPVAPPTVAPTPPPPPPGVLTLSARTIDLGPTATGATLTLSNTGGRTIDWSISGGGAPFSVGATGGSLAPGASVAVPIGVDRTGRSEGDISTQFGVASSSGVGPTALTVRASVERAPVVSITTAPSLVNCPIGIGQPVRASVTDDSAIASVTLSWSGPGNPGSTAMALRTGNWFGRLVPEAVNGAWTITVTATDVRGNSATATRPVVVSGC